MTRNTRKKILDAALKLFSKKGYLGATTREIARQAGVAELTLFRHFASKERLFEEVIRSYSFLETLRDIMPELLGMEYRLALLEIARRFLDRLNERRELIRIMHSEIQLYPAKVREIYDRFIEDMFRTLASYFSELQARGVMRRLNHELAARAFLGMVFSYFNSKKFMSQKSYGCIAVEEVLEGFVDIFVAGTLADTHQQGASGPDKRP